MLATHSPAQLLSSTGTDFQWPDAAAAAATPASTFGSLDGLTQFDPNAWMSSPPLDGTMGFGGGGQGMDQSAGAVAAMPTTGLERGSGLFSSSHPQQFPMDVSNFASMNEWPALDDEATKQLLAMMDSSAAVDLGGFDASVLGIMGGTSNAEPTFGLNFAQQQQLSTQPAADNAKPACNSKREEGCGPCCG